MSFLEENNPNLLFAYLIKMFMYFQAADTISDLEQAVDTLKRSLKDAEEQRQRQMRVNFYLLYLNFVLYSETCLN
jgi:hypothetical protein